MSHHSSDVHQDQSVTWPREWKELNRVAWIRPGALGDLLVGLAALSETANAFPKARVTVIGPRLWLGILSPAAFPFVEKIAAVERRGHLADVFVPQGEEWVPTGESMPVSKVLSGFDGVVNLNIDSYRYGFSALKAGVPVRVGSAPTPMASILYTHSSPFFGKDPLVHERDAALMVLEYATTGLNRLFQTTAKNRRELASLIETSRLIRKWRAIGLPSVKAPDSKRAVEITGCEAGSYLLVNPTSSRRTNTWPTEKFREFLLSSKDTLTDLGLEPIVIGAPHETQWLREIAGDEFKIVQTKSLRDLADVVAGARALLTNTSSMQFLAASMRTPTVTLMGRARPEIWGPIGPRDRIVRGVAPPELARDIFRQEEEAYRSIPVAKVREEVLSLLAITP